MKSGLAQILLVDDDMGDVILTREALKQVKAVNPLHVARDGYEALSFLRREKGFESAPRPDLILLDLNMPRMDGRELLAEIKSDEDLSTIPVVILTTSDNELDVETTYRLHANGYITKPVDLKGFVTVVQSLNDYWFGVVRLPGKEALASG